MKCGKGKMMKEKGMKSMAKPAKAAKPMKMAKATKKGMPPATAKRRMKG